MRNMSFSLTTKQCREMTKDVTRRLGWATLKPGDHFQAVEKGMGLKKGEKVVRLHECICISNTPEPLADIIRRPFRAGRSECEREGFPEMTPAEFVTMFCTHNKVEPEAVIRRIEFAYMAGR